MCTKVPVVLAQPLLCTYANLLILKMTSLRSIVSTVWPFPFTIGILYVIFFSETIENHLKSPKFQRRHILGTH